MFDGIQVWRVSWPFQDPILLLTEVFLDNFCRVLRIVVMLEKQFLWMLQLKSMSEDAGMHLTDIINTIAFRQEVDEETGEVKRSRGEIGEFQAKKYLQQASHMSSAELQRAVSLCETADEDFKTGRMNDKMATETLLVKLCNGK